MVARELALLPSGWDVFNGVPRSGLEGFAGGSDFDHIVIGPDTMFVIETKNWEGPISLGHGLLRVRGRAPRRSPVAQVRRESMELAAILKDIMPEGIIVTPVICFAGDGFIAEESKIDDVSVCNARMLRNIILAQGLIHLSKSTRMEKSIRQMILVENMHIGLLNILVVLNKFLLMNPMFALE